MTDKLSEDLRSLRIDRDAPSSEEGSRRTWLWVVLGLIVLVGGGYAAASKFEGALFPTEVELTQVALVSPSSGSTVLNATGYVQAKVRSMVGVKMRGRVAKIHVVEGQRVEAGQLMLELEAADQRSAVAAARARVAAAQARAEAAKANAAEVETQLRRSKVLAAGGATAQSEVEDLEARLRSLQQAVSAAAADVNAAHAEAKLLAQNLEDLTVEAPIGGTVVSRPPEVGELLSDAPALELVDMGSLVVEADVPEARLGMIRVGSPAEIVLDAFPNERRRGEVVEIGSKVNRAKATVMVRVRFLDDTTRVLPEMAARVSILDKAPDPELLKAPPKKVVPKVAVTQRGGSPVVFVVEGNQVRLTPINLGPEFGDGFELQSGLAVSAKLVRQPATSLMDGQKIKERVKE